MNPSRKIAAIAILLLCRNLTADTVILSDGDTLTGKISAENTESITIDTSSGRFTFPRTKVRSATRVSPWENQKQQLVQYLSSGKLDAAFQIYQHDELQQYVPPHAFNELFHQHLKNSALVATATSPTATALLHQVSSDPDSSPELRILTSALILDYGNQTSPTELLRKIASAPPSILDWPSPTVSGLLDGIANSSLHYKNGELLAISTDLATRLPLSIPASNNQLSDYSRINDLINHKVYLEAVALFKPDHFLHRADMFIPLAERMITALIAAPPTESNLAALQSSRATVLDFIDRQLTVKTLKYIVNRLIDSDRIEQAQKLTDDYSQSDPDLSATLQHLLEFRQRRKNLDPDSPLTHYRLAAWARSMGLNEEAKSIFLELRPDPRFTETVNLQLDLIGKADAQKTYRYLRELYDKNQYDRLQTAAQVFLHSNPPDPYGKDTKGLLQIIDFEKWNAKRSASGKAEAEFQQAERLAQRGEYDAALTQLNRLQLDRSDTNAAQRAQTLRDKIMREKLKRSRSIRPQ